MQTPKRGIWIATAAVLLGGLVVILWVTSPAEGRRREIMDRLELGDSASRVVALLGEAPARCPGAELAHLGASFPPGWPGSSSEAALQALGVRTHERWVYPLGPGRPAGCDPREGQTEIGISPDGTILWYVAVTGKTPLRLPAEISPASPDGAASDR